MILNEPLLALSWKEPYASMMLHDKIETRTWNTKYRGLVLICASRKFYSESEVMAFAGEVLTQKIFVTLLNAGTKEKRGNAIAIGRLTDCRPMLPEDEANCFVKYREPWQVQKKKKDGTVKIITKRLYRHVYEDVRAIEPFPWKGTQGWRKVTKEIIEQLQWKKAA